MSDSATWGAAALGALLPIAKDGLVKMSSALIESGVNPIKLNWLMETAGQLHCDPEINQMLERFATIRSLPISRAAAAFLIPISPILSEGLMKTTEGRTLVAVISIWELVVEDTVELSHRLLAWANATPSKHKFPLPDPRDLRPCVVPAFANEMRPFVTTLYDSLVHLDEIWNPEVVRDRNHVEAISHRVCGEVVSAITQASQSTASESQTTSCHWHW